MSNGGGSRQPEQWRRPVRHQPSVTTLKSRQRKLSQIQQLLFALLTLAAELPHGRLEKKSGLCIWNPSHTRPSFSFLFLTRSPSSPSSTSVGTLTSVLWKPADPFFHSTQGATQDSWNRREPGLTHHLWYSIPALWSSEPPAPFPGPIVITKDLLSKDLNSKARKHPSPLMWEADIDLERHGWGLCWGKPRRKSRPLHGALNQGDGLAPWSSKSVWWTSCCYHNRRLLDAGWNGVTFSML